MAVAQLPKSLKKVKDYCFLRGKRLIWAGYNGIEGGFK